MGDSGEGFGNRPFPPPLGGSVCKMNNAPPSTNFKPPVSTSFHNGETKCGDGSGGGGGVNPMGSTPPVKTYNYEATDSSHGTIVMGGPPVNTSGSRARK